MLNLTLTNQQKQQATELRHQLSDLCHGAEVHCRSTEELVLANHVAGILGRLDLEIVLEAQQQLSK